MLTNELCALDALPGGEPGGDVLAEICPGIMERWQDALFSGTGDEVLRRYFSFHLQGIARLSAASTRDDRSEALCRLTAHLIDRYGGFLDDQLLLPAFYCARWRERQANRTEALLAIIQSSVTDGRLNNCLADYLAQYAPKANACSYTLRSVRYFEHFCDTIGAALPGCGLQQALLDLNFNHLAYLGLLRERFRGAALPSLREELRELTERPVQMRWQYHPDWPPLPTMLCACLREEISAQERAAPAASTGKKIPLNLSVAQLACLIRLMYEEDIFGTANLSEIFRCFSQHFSSKRQERISPGGLAKEYYGTDLVTAAVMQGKLKQMLARITRAFFPG